MAKPIKDEETEAANRTEITALLIREHYRVYRPEADCYGEDLVLRFPDNPAKNQFPQWKAVTVRTTPGCSVEISPYGGQEIQKLPFSLDALSRPKEDPCFRARMVSCAAQGFI